MCGVQRAQMRRELALLQEDVAVVGIYTKSIREHGAYCLQHAGVNFKDHARFKLAQFEGTEHKLEMYTKSINTIMSTCEATLSSSQCFDCKRQAQWLLSRVRPSKQLHEHMLKLTGTLEQNMVQLALDTVALGVKLLKKGPLVKEWNLLVNSNGLSDAYWVKGSGVAFQVGDESCLAEGGPLHKAFDAWYNSVSKVFDEIEGCKLAIDFRSGLTVWLEGEALVAFTLKQDCLFAEFQETIAHLVKLHNGVSKQAVDLHWELLVAICEALGISLPKPVDNQQ